jgi:hypothetical protein
MTENSAGVGPVERGVRPRALLLAHKDGRETLHPISEYAVAYRDTAVSETLLYDQEALEATADDAARVAREAEAHYWHGMVERLTAQADEWNRRYMALLQQVADGRAMQPAPAILVDLGPNTPAETRQTAQKDTP